MFKCRYKPTESILIEMLRKPCCFLIQEINPNHSHSFMWSEHSSLKNSVNSVQLIHRILPKIYLWIAGNAFQKSERNALEFRLKSLIQCANLGDYCEMEGAGFIFDAIQTFQFAHELKGK